MFNLKWSALAGGFAFTLSLVIGLVSGAGAASVPKALIFTAVFFVAGSITRLLIGKFLPELLNETANLPAGNKPGSQVDISVEDNIDSDEIDIDTIPDDESETASTLDQKDKEAYTKKGG
ncbi:MAG: hypothetical protein LBG76_06480, partial [Treponema sp.]|nr:hypothetical protein [Treponema sp.]